jgi:integrase/recombinase XerD
MMTLMRDDELPEHAYDFLGSIRSERGLSQNTVDAYRRDLRQYRSTIVANGGAATPAVVQTHLRVLRTAGLADSSIARKFASLRAYHRFLVVEGYRDDDPTATIDAPSRPKPLPKALTVDEVAAILLQPDPSDPMGIRDVAVLEFLYATGCRVSELCGTDLHDVDLETKSVLVTGKGNKQRIVPLGSYAVTAIGSWLPVRLDTRVSGRDPGALFLSSRGNRLNRQSVWRIVQKYGVAADVEESRLSPHVFRHSAATHMVEGGADLRTVQEILGHASLSTTQVYTKVSPEHLREVVITSHPRGRARGVISPSVRVD